MPANCAPVSVSCTADGNGGCAETCTNAPDGNIAQGGGQDCAGACQWVDTANCGEQMLEITSTCNPACDGTRTQSISGAAIQNCH